MFFPISNKITFHKKKIIHYYLVLLHVLHASLEPLLISISQNTMFNISCNPKASPF